MSRPYGARGLPPGTMARLGTAQPLPITPVPAIPGGTLVNPVPQPGTRTYRAPVGVVGTVNVPRSVVLRLAANATRGSGFAGTKASEGLVHSIARKAGVRSNHSLLGAIVQADIRNPYVAPYVLASSMTAGATRIR